MLRDAADRKDESGAPTWAQQAPAWRVIDRALRSLAKQRAGLDAEEARWIRQAEAAQIWRPLGMVNLLDYLERACGFLRPSRPSPSTAPGCRSPREHGAARSRPVRRPTRQKREQTA